MASDRNGNAPRSCASRSASRIRAKPDRRYVQTKALPFVLDRGHKHRVSRVENPEVRMVWIAHDGHGADRGSLWALFNGFLKVALCSVGGSGGIVFARRLVVEQRRWIDDRDFADILSFCQFMPGPNIVGVAVCVGSRVRGPIGALAGVAGFTLIPLTISFSVGAWCLRNTDLGI